MRKALVGVLATLGALGLSAGDFDIRAFGAAETNVPKDNSAVIRIGVGAG